MIARPVDRLDITLNLGLLDTEIKDFVSAGTDYSGNRLALSPKVNFSGVANYEIRCRTPSRSRFSRRYPIAAASFLDRQQSAAEAEGLLAARRPHRGQDETGAGKRRFSVGT